VLSNENLVILSLAQSAGSLVVLNELFASVRDVAQWRGGKAGQDRIRHKQRSPHPATARQRPDGSPLFIPFLTLTWLYLAPRRVLYFAFGSYSLVPREQDLDAKSTVNGWRRGDDRVFSAVQNRSVAPRVAVFALH
jgi:hypothetical protein